MPDRIESGAAPLDFAALSALTFTAPDFARFPCLKLAYQAMHAGGSTPCVLNAANEVAVAAFLDGRLRFTDIARVVDSCLQQHQPSRPDSIEALLEWDHHTRNAAGQAVERLSNQRG